MQLAEEKQEPLTIAGTQVEFEMPYQIMTLYLVPDR